MTETAARMPERRMAEAAAVHAPKSALVESTTMKPAAMEPTAAWPGQRKATGAHQQRRRNAGAPSCAKRFVVHGHAPLLRMGAPHTTNDHGDLWFRAHLRVPADQQALIRFKRGHTRMPALIEENRHERRRVDGDHFGKPFLLYR